MLPQNCLNPSHGNIRIVFSSHAHMIQRNNSSQLQLTPVCFFPPAPPQLHQLAETGYGRLHLKFKVEDYDAPAPLSRSPSMASQRSQTDRRSSNMSGIRKYSCVASPCACVCVMCVVVCARLSQKEPVLKQIKLSCTFFLTALHFTVQGKTG